MDATTGFPASFPYILAVDWEGTTEELVKVTAASGTTLTIERAFGGTSAQSHSLGAVVRHVYNAQDATDFRTHEDATGAVHGLTGDIVGTSDTQTISSKTFTSNILFNDSPEFEGGAVGNAIIRGRVAGDANPRYAVIADGGTAWGDGTNPVDVELFRNDVDVLATKDTFRVFRSAVGENAHSVRVTGDVASRLLIAADGKVLWGDGTNPQDVELFRDAVDVLATNDLFRVYRSVVGDNAVSVRLVGDAASRLLVNADGKTFWGDGTNTVDTNLYRSAANTLKTDDTFLAANMRAGRAQTPTPGASPAQTSVAVTFTTAMAGTPRITATPNSVSTDLNNSNIRWAIAGESATGFTINCWRDTDAATNFDWIAISDTE
ncbi:H-type lectin domain-containing protein [Streptomyces halobius]|uniref:H-type lectin domain-containing protein n=1 Tax=Streptomyces halobius TaxID=2879846 RepID=A0ABY4M1S5_9ACTN|nr:H-type lectin domain-containing protein [Streptomyces halobius]UQA91628.1 H-type lectin domain-containing protein [Streptomyces halobius]